MRGVKGFGEKTEQRILEGIRRMRERAANPRVLLVDAREVGDLVWLPKTVGGGAVVADLKTPRFLPQDTMCEPLLSLMIRSRAVFPQT